ncbi:MAG: divalent-cation tolerance protein CutA [Thermoplasmata archaeon]
MQKLILIYVTARDRTEGLKIARCVVRERLAACANVFRIRSVYWWKGRVEEGGEVAVVLKSRTELLRRLVARIRELHSYELPCVVAVPIMGGNPAFLRWIKEETGSAAKPDPAER